MLDFFIYMVWLVGFLIATFWISNKLFPEPPPLPKHLRPIRTQATNDRECIGVFIYIIGILIVAHVIFNMFVVFQFPPEPPQFGSHFTMQTTDNGKTFTRGNSIMYIYIPFTNIKLYGPDKVTYYPDMSQVNYYYKSNNYTVISSDGVPMSVSLMWNFNGEWPNSLTDADKEAIFYKRGPNWEVNYATSIVTQEFAQNIASRFTSGTLQVGSTIDDLTLLKVKTADFNGYITISYNIIDDTTRDCFYEDLSNSVYSYHSGPDITYGEPGDIPQVKPDKCAEPTTLNRVTLN